MGFFDFNRVERFCKHCCGLIMRQHISNGICNVYWVSHTLKIRCATVGYEQWWNKDEKNILRSNYFIHKYIAGSNVESMPCFKYQFYISKRCILIFLFYFTSNVKCSNYVWQPNKSASFSFYISPNIVNPITL